MTTISNTVANTFGASAVTTTIKAKKQTKIPSLVKNKILLAQAETVGNDDTRCYTSEPDFTRAVNERPCIH